ncbi:MAG: PAS domain-containing protein [Desulfovermiculus sp.]
MENPARALYHSIDACPAAVAVINPMCTIQFANLGMLEFLGLPLQDVVGRKCFQLMHGKSETIQGCPLIAMLKSKRRTEVEVDLGDKRYKVAAEPIFTYSQRLLGALHIMTDANQFDALSLELDHILTNARNVLAPEQPLWKRVSPPFGPLGAFANEPIISPLQ